MNLPHFVRRLRGLLVALAAAQAVSATAQIEQAPSQFAACLTPAGEARNQLRYPEDALRDRISGVTTVEMEFIAPDAPPEVKVIYGTEARLNDVVVDHVRRYRVPCLAAGSKVRFTQQFVFVPNREGKVSWTDVDEPADPSTMSCVSHLRPGSKPDWPLGSGLSIGRPGMSQGVVLARIRFTSKDGPPEVDIPETPIDSSFARSVREWASDYRLPCYSGKAVEAIQLFRFKYVGFPDSPLLRDTTLTGFLSAVRVDGQRRYFELDRMSCPFNVKFEYRQPLMRNRVGEIGAHVDGRQPFLDWLAGLRFDTRATTENLLLGESMTISVPCGKIDL